jgi:hypothetical protein
MLKDDPKPGRAFTPDEEYVSGRKHLPQILLAKPHASAGHLSRAKRLEATGVRESQVQQS